MHDTMLVVDCGCTVFFFIINVIIIYIYTLLGFDAK